VVLHADERDGSLRQAATQRGMPTLLYEAGPPLRHEEGAVRTGVEGVQRVMAALGMRGPGAPGSGPRSLESHETHWVRAPGSGYLVLETDLGRQVARDALLGTLYVGLHEDFFKEDHVEIRAPVAGVVIGLDRNPLVNVGEAVVHIAVATAPKRRRA
jgi:predicted deacylase